MRVFTCPELLKLQDGVSVIAPAGAVPADAFFQGLALVQAVGLQPRWHPDLLERTRYFAGSRLRRQAELRQALQDPTTKVIWAARGGYGTAHLLAGLSLDEILGLRKWLVGFSDLTGLHGLWQQAGLLSVHGANITTLPSWSSAAREELFSLLGLPPLGQAEAALPLDAPASCRVQTDAHRATALVQTFLGTMSGAPDGAQTGTYRGRLWGGNLTVLASLVGSGTLPGQDHLGGPSILLLEEIGEAPYRLDRCWQQLVASGHTAGVVAVAIGQLSHCEAKDADYTAHDMLCGAIENSGLPWIAGLPLGHAPDARPIRLGGLATLDVAQGRLKVGL